MNRRREFITLLGGAAAAWPLAGRAQQGERMRRVGVLLPAAEYDRVYQDRVGAFLRGAFGTVTAPAAPGQLGGLAESVHRLQSGVSNVAHKMRRWWLARDPGDAQ
jgi:hypothetical protein